MPAYVALLRAVNIAGRNRIAMSLLREICESLGCSEVKTLVQSGNAVFRSRLQPAPLAKKLADAIRGVAGLDITVVIRTGEQLTRVIERNPFPVAAQNDPGHLLVDFLTGKPAKGAEQALAAAVVGPESLQLDGEHLYVHYPAGVGTSKLTSNLIERKLGVQGTARNWNTVTRLAEMTRG